MINNYYFRLVEKGETTLEQIAREADNKIRRGDDMGPPPSPTYVPKRNEIA